MNTIPTAKHSDVPGTRRLAADEAAPGDPESATAGVLLSNLERQLVLFGRLDQLSERQSKLVSAADTQPLVAILDQRRQITSDLAALTNQLPKSSSGSPTGTEQWSNSDRQRAKEMLARIRGHLQKLIKRDAVDARILSTRKNQTHAGIAAMHSGHQAVTAYGRTTAARHPKPTRTSREA